MVKVQRTFGLSLLDEDDLPVERRFVSMMPRLNLTVNKALDSQELSQSAMQTNMQPHAQWRYRALPYSIFNKFKFSFSFSLHFTNN